MITRLEISSELKASLRAWSDGQPQMRSALRHVTQLFDDGATFSALCGFYVVGGALRGYLNGTLTAPRDVDIIMTRITPSKFRGLAGNRLNRFGGAKVVAGDVEVDIWPLSQTYYIRRFGLSKDISGFFEGCQLNIDKIAYNIDYGTLHDGGGLMGARERIIKFAAKHPCKLHLQALRCLVMREKHQYELHSSAQWMIDNVRRSPNLPKAMDAIMGYERSKTKLPRRERMRLYEEAFGKERVAAIFSRHERAR